MLLSPCCQQRMNLSSQCSVIICLPCGGEGRKVEMVTNRHYLHIQNASQVTVKSLIGTFSGRHHS